jgi:hypothetical protein
MKLLIYTANLGNFDKTQENEEQELPEGITEIEYWRCTEEDFPLRKNSMTPRLQARIVKMFGWQFKPGFDYYLWVDSSCRLPRADSSKWFMEQLGDKQMAVFKHNVRNTLRDEANYLKMRLLEEKAHRKLPYVLPRYENEDINGQMSEVDPNLRLYASTAFIYRDTFPVREALKEWWYFTSRYHSIDQLGLSEAIKTVSHNVIEENYLKCEYLKYVR